MTYAADEARQELLDAIVAATDRIAIALANLGAAYELLDETTADVLEEQLFRPAQTAYGRAKRTHAAFAGRSGLPSGTFAEAVTPAPSHGVAGLIERAIDAAIDADEALASLQDSLKPIEVGDPELRAGLSEVRRLISQLEPRGRRFLATVGR